MKWFKMICLGLILTSCGSSREVESGSRLSQAEENKFDYFFLESERMKNLGKEDAAFDLMKKAAAIDTANAVASYELAQYYLKLGRPLIALDYLTRAAQKDPENYWYGMLQAHVLQNTGNIDEAVRVYKHLTEVFPKKPEISYSLADAYTRKGDIPDAIASLDMVEENIGVMETVTMEKFQLYMSLEDKEGAFNEIKKLIEAYPGNVQYQIRLGDLYLDYGMLKEAREAYDAAARTDASNVYLIVSQSEYYNKIGDIAASNELLKKALVNDRLDVDTKVKILTGYLKTLLQKNESLAETDSIFSVIIEQHPHESDIHSLYAELLIASERFKDAKEQLGYAVDSNPMDERLWLQLLGMNMRLEEWPEAVKTCDRALEYFPQTYQFHLYKGVAYGAEKEYEKALMAYRKGLEMIDQQNVQAISDLWGQIGDVYAQLEQKDKAYAAYDEALKYNDKNIGVLNNYSYFLSEEKRDLSKAEKMAGMVVKLEPSNPTYLDTYAWIFFQQGNYMLAKFYIESALTNGGSDSDVLLEHYGDILYMDGEKEKALEQWKKSLEMGNQSEVLKKKIQTETYIQE